MKVFCHTIDRVERRFELVKDERRSSFREKVFKQFYRFEKWN